jgi:hypothetical protein
LAQQVAKAPPKFRYLRWAARRGWSSQFGVNIKSVGVPSAAEEVAITQGSLEEASFVATYSKEGQLVAAVTCNQAKWLEH